MIQCFATYSLLRNQGKIPNNYMRSSITLWTALEGSKGQKVEPICYIISSTSAVGFQHAEQAVILPFVSGLAQLSNFYLAFEYA